MENELITRIIIDFVYIFIALILIYWKSYWGEKGKNYATKKDIEDITKKIETVKNEIGIHSQRRLEYLNDRKKAALDLLGSISIWLDYTLRPMDRIYNNPLDLKVLAELIVDLKNKGSEATTNFWKITIYYENEIFIEVVDKLYRSCIDLHNFTNKFLINIERKAVLVNDKLERLEKSENIEYKKKMKQEVEALHKDANKIIKEYTKDAKEYETITSKNRLEYLVVLNKVLKIKNPTP